MCMYIHESHCAKIMRISLRVRFETLGNTKVDITHFLWKFYLYLGAHVCPSAQIV